MALRTIAGMHVTRPGCPRRAAGNAVSLALASGLCGCAESLPGTAAWIYISLATAAVAAASYLLGTLSARAALRRSRDEGRRWSRLQSDCTWETDASHRLVAWRAPGQLPGAAPDGLFYDGAAAAGLAAHLQAQQAFAGLRVRTAAARGTQAGSNTPINWRSALAGLVKGPSTLNNVRVPSSRRGPTA